MRTHSDGGNYCQFFTPPLFVLSGEFTLLAQTYLEVLPRVYGPPSVFSLLRPQGLRAGSRRLLKPLYGFVACARCGLHPAMRRPVLTVLQVTLVGVSCCKLREAIWFAWCLILQKLSLR